LRTRNSIAKKFVTKIVFEHGMLEKILTDQGTNFLELTKLNLSIEEISHNIENQGSNILRNKYFMYPIGSGTLVVIIFSIVGIIT